MFSVIATLHGSALASAPGAPSFFDSFSKYAKMHWFYKCFGRPHWAHVRPPKGTAKIRKRKNLEIDVENVRTRQQFSLGNLEIVLSNILGMKNLDFQKCARQKWRNLWSKISKIEKSENRRRKHGDASMIFIRKFRNVAFCWFVRFCLRPKQKNALVLFEAAV